MRTPGTQGSRDALSWRKVINGPLGGRNASQAHRSQGCGSFDGGRVMSKWRDTYKFYPSSDWFPVMSEDELDALAVEDPADPRGASEDEGVKIIRHVLD